MKYFTLYKYFHDLRFKCLYKNVSPIRMKTRPSWKNWILPCSHEILQLVIRIHYPLPPPNLKPRFYDDLSSPKLFLLCKRFRNFLFMQLFLPLFDVDFVSAVSVRGLRTGVVQGVPWHFDRICWMNLLSNSVGEDYKREPWSKS